MSVKTINRFWKVALLTGLVLALTMNTVLSSNATSFDELQKQKNTYDEKKSELEERLNQTESEISEKSNAIGSIMAELRVIEDEIQELTERIAPLERSMFEAMELIESLHNEVVALENKTRQREVVVTERVRAMQVQGGPVSYLDVLLGFQQFPSSLKRIK